MPARYRRPVKDDSSDSEPDVAVQVARRRWGAGDAAAPAATAAAAAEKKKKKKRLPPQESIDRAWAHFSAKRFSKAMTVLPFAPVAPSPLSDRANELLSRGYERAAEECRRKVHKIIQECRRVNMRYRDPGWDLDWDLKMGRGHCLNSLGTTSFDVSHKNMLRISASVPKAVKRVHEIFETPTFMATASGSDVKQGSLGDCWFVSCVSGLANVAGGLQRCCVAHDARVGIYGFVFFRDGEWIYSIIDDKLYLTSPSWDAPSFQRDLLQQIDQDDLERVYRKTYQTGSKALFFAQNKDANETWLPLMEKAYAKAHGDYASLAGGWMGEGLEDLTGGVTTELLLSDILDVDGFWDRELSRVNDEFLFGCTTGLLDGGTGDRDGITEGHAYNVVAARTLRDGTRLLKLRNPWGKVKAGTWSGAWSDGSKEWTAAVQAELGHTFGSDSTFWIAYEDFLLKYQHVDRTRLFRDDGAWRCCQRWLAVDVPWQAAAARCYHETFRLRLARAGPLVLVLAQLDARYFRGLAGPYRFRLHFRLHARDRPDAEDYVVRSHGNYLMERAVSVELPALPPGAYAVFVSVVAERETGTLAVEDTVRRELRARADNEKLAQVGQAYDLAHSKAAAHMAARAALRNKADQAGASDARRAERRKAWARRHLLVDLQRRQQAKNEQKKQARREEKARDKKDKRQKAKAKAKAAEEKPGTAAAAVHHHDKGVQADLPTPATTDQAAAPSPAASASTSGTSTPQSTPLGTPMSEPASVDAAVPSVAPATAAEAVPAGAGGKEAEGKCCSCACACTGTTCGAAAANNKGAAADEDEDKDDDDDDDVNDDDDSSDSPISDWEEWYSSDDLSTLASRNGRRARDAGSGAVGGGGSSGSGGGGGGGGNAKEKGGAAAGKDDGDSDESDDEADRPAPWNAICVVGLRVYSKDEGLELEVVQEGGSLAEGGMGARGSQDLDNAQANAGGQRVLEGEGEAATAADLANTDGREGEAADAADE